MKTTANTDRVWSLLLGYGMNEFGAAAMLGNLYSESGVIPNRLENLCRQRLRTYTGEDWTDEAYTAAVDSGEISKEEFLHPIPNKQYGYGLAQWTSPGRKGRLYDMCRKLGVSIGDLDTQVAFLYSELATTYLSVFNACRTAKTVKEASDVILVKFESPANAEGMKATRTKYGQFFYDAYHKETTHMKPNEVTICGHGSARPTIKNMETYCAGRYSQKASNGVRKGLAAVRRLKVLDDTGRIGFRDAYSTILGRNRYSQALREYVYTKYKDGLYYSDCSSSGCYTFKHIGVKCADLNTAGIYESSSFETVPVQIQNGQIINPEILKVGDALLFVGNDPSRPKQIGHVEWVYQMPGDEPSPTPRTLKKGCKGEDVKQMQQLLINAGYPCGSYGADGDFGGATLAAVRSFQRDNDLEVDGVYGPKTRAALEAISQKTKHVKADKANVRNGAGLSFTTIATLNKGASVDLAGEESKERSTGWMWVKIRFAGGNGWVAKHLLD